MSLAAGARLGPYEIVSPLGAGGMGEVYRARDSRLERDIAIKVLPAHLAKDPEALARFEREAKAVASLSHPNILAIHDFGREQGISFSVTELLEGETLRNRLMLSPLPWRKAVEIAIAVADGLSAAHSKGITHRDLKPENLFLTSDGRVKILDFGLARWRPYSDSTETEIAETDPGTILGTVLYMSPEQVRGMPVEATSDIFSLGCVLYEVIAGRKAFARPSAAETMAAILREDPPELSGSGKTIPPDVERLIQHCLEKNPQERFQSARDLAFALRAVLSDSGSTRQVAQRSRKAIDSLAVLPFANTSTDPNVDYLSDGLTENLINNLAQLPKLRIVPRSIVFRFKGRDVDPRSVGRELGVRALLTGRVLLRGDTLNIQTELVDVVAQSQIWGAQYNRKFSDIFLVQEEIAGEICEKLRVQLSSEQKKRLTQRHTQDTEAYQLYLKGRYYWNRRTPDKVNMAIELFQQAIDKDPRFAPAYAGLADSYASLGIYGALTPKESFPKLKAAAGKALELDESLGEAHATMAWARGFYDWDWAAAEAQFKRALELKTSYATAHHFYAFLLIAVGRFDEGVAESKRAQEIEPLSVVVNAGLSLAYYHARQYDQSILQAGKTIELEPTYGAAHFSLGLAREQKGMLEEAIASFQRGSELLSGNPRAVAGLGHAYAASGRTDEARKVLDELRERSKQRYVAPAEFVPLCAGLGENDEALEWLEKAYQDRSLWLAWVNADPRSDSLRHDPRFRDVMRRIGLQK